MDGSADWRTLRGAAGAQIVQLSALPIRRSAHPTIPLPASRPPAARAHEAAGLRRDARVAIGAATLNRRRVHGGLQLGGLSWRGVHGSSVFSAFIRVCLANISRPIEPATTQLNHYAPLS